MINQRRLASSPVDWWLLMHDGTADGELLSIPLDHREKGRDKGICQLALTCDGTRNRIHC